VSILWPTNFMAINCDGGACIKVSLTPPKTTGSPSLRNCGQTLWGEGTMGLENISKKDAAKN